MNQSSKVRLFSKTEIAPAKTFSKNLPDLNQFEINLKQNLEDFAQWIDRYQDANLHFDDSWGTSIIESQILGLIDVVRHFQKSGNRLAGSKIRSLTAVMRANQKLIPYVQNAKRVIRSKASDALSDTELHNLIHNVNLDSRNHSESFHDILFTRTMREMEDHYHLIISQRRTSTALKLVSCFAIPLLMLWNR